MKKHCILIACVMLCTTLANAQWGFIKKAAKATVKVTTAPFVSTYNTAKVITGNARPSSIYKPYSHAIGATSKVVPEAVKVLNYPQNLMMQKAQEFASINRYSGFIFDLGTFTNRYYPNLEIALANNVSAVANGRNPLEVVAAPLAAALRAAEERHLASSRPIPDDVKNALRGYFSEATLNRARYTIGHAEITLANFIGHAVKFGEPFAVTAGNVIVFNSNPGSFRDSPLWWVHELTHIQQYERMGIENFAFNYMRDLGRSLERDANNNANRIIYGN